MLKRYAAEAGTQPALANLYATALELEQQCVKQFAAKKLFPNVDYFSGLVYRELGIDAQMFTPIFALSRTAGWVARLVEYLPQNRLFRPRSVYTGPAPRTCSTI